MGTRDEEKRKQSRNLLPDARSETAAVAEDLRVSPLTIRLFGPFEVRLHGQPLPRLRSRKGQWLLALLTLRHGNEVERGRLAGTLWPDSTETAAYASLRNSLKDLRQALGGEAGRLRAPTPRTLSLDLYGADADVIAFDAAIAQGETVALERAVALYRGPLLEGCAEEWALPERQTRELACLTALETLAAAALSRSDPAAAERYLRQTVLLDPLRETAQRALMQVLAAGGNSAAATQIHRELRLRLHRELNAEPDAETQALYQRLRAEARAKADGATGRRGDGAIWPDPAALSVAPSPPRPVAPSLPTGTVTFLLTDIEGSTKLWLEDPEAMRQALARHDALAAAIIPQHDGLLLKQRGEGDSLFAVFPRASDAVAAALEFQQALARESWPAEGQPQGLPLQVRVALHTGEAERREGDYYGLAVNHCARLRAVGHGGQTLLSQTTAALVREDLPAEASLRELGAHRLKDLQRPEPIFQLAHPELQANNFPPLRSLEAFAHNLPVQLTSFIGREREIAEVKRLLATTHLLTLTGAGGCGKTRLALQVAADLVEAYADGVWLVELAALSDPGLVPQTVAAALGVREQPNRPLTATLADHFQARTLLLVLDNCEHLLAACAGLAEELLRRCAGLRMLATSREGLHLAGETTYRVPPLSLPDLKRLPPVDLLTQCEAARLFVERAMAALPSFTLTDQNAAAVAAVCRRLDGIPLAIELAAARVKALPVEQLAARMDDFFRLLTGGNRTALPRQQTLRATIDWSYDLLCEPERTLLRRLSVFAGGWKLEAAEAVCAGEGIEEWEVLDLLTSLVEKSLVVYEEQRGEARYRLLETVRQYARDRLLGTGETEALRDRHLAFFLDWVEIGQERLRSARPAEWFDHLEGEHDNLRTALEWSLTVEGSADTALRLAFAMEQFWLKGVYAGEGREWLTRALVRDGRVPAASRARALRQAGRLAEGQGDYGAARSLVEQSLTLAQGLGDSSNTAYALHDLAFIAFCQAEYEQAKALAEEALAILGELGNRQGVADALMLLGYVARGQGDTAAERSHYEQALALRRELGVKWGIAHSLHNLGHVARSEGSYEVARLHYREGLAGFQELADTLDIALVLEGFAALAAAEGKLRRSARLWGAADALHEALSLPMSPVDHITYDPYIEAVRTALGEEAFAAAWAEGRAMPMEQAVDYALEGAGADAPAP